MPSPVMRLVTSKDSIGKKMINGVSIPKRGPTIQNSIGHKVSENRGRNMHEEIRKAQSLNLVLFFSMQHCIIEKFKQWVYGAICISERKIDE